MAREHVIAVDLGVELDARIDREWERMKKTTPPGIHVSKSDAVRSILIRGLAAPK